MHVGGIADQEDVSRAVAIGLTGVLPGDAAQRMWPWPRRRLDGQVDTEHPTRAVTQLVERHRLRIIAGLIELDGPDHRPVTLELGVDEPTAVESVVPEGQRAHARHIDAAVGAAHFVGHPHVSDSGDRVGRVAREVDACQLANGAAATVGADEVRRLQRVSPIRSRHVDRGAAGSRLDADQFVAPTDVDTEFACPLVKQPDKLRLRHHQRIHRVVGNAEERHRHSTEYPLVRGVRRIVRSGEPLVEPTHIQLSNHLADHAVGLRLVAGRGQSLEHHGPNAGQRQLARHHESIRACT